MKKLGLGIQELSKLRKDGYIYVDKTEIIYKLITTGSYYFLSRPRRFGKSLLVNTMEEIFNGNKELFKETWIYDKWNFEEKFPVIKIDFSKLDYNEVGLDSAIKKRLNSIGEEYNIKLNRTTMKEMFLELIEKMGKKNPVAILIDEYDKPIIDYVESSKREKAVENREILKNFYSVIKGSDKYIKLFFLTGISKFSKVSIFSDLNNVTDITIHRNYSTIAGYTEKEIADNYEEYLKNIEDKFRIGRKKAMEMIKSWYDGYSWNAENFVYNPYSILNFFDSEQFKNFWFKSGTATFLTKLIKEKGLDVRDYDKLITIPESALDSYNIENINMSTLLFQTG
ncbi:MAG: AAA family ATPase, partial [Candidatus Delongbacteria bacterium]